MPGPAPEQLTSDPAAYGATSEIVRAGAGAGKTYALTHKVMDLADDYVREHQRFPRLIVTTFTRKATQELRERLMLLALEERPHLVDFVNSRAHLVVSTIHGVMDMYLKRYGANICVDPAYRVIGAPEATKLARQTLRQILLDPAAGGGVARVAGARAGTEVADHRAVLENFENDDSGGSLLESFPFNTLVRLVRHVDTVLAENPAALPFRAGDFELIFRERAQKAVELFREVAARIRAETSKENWLEIAAVCETFVRLLEQGTWAENRAHFLMAREAMPVARRGGKGASPVDEVTIDLAKQARELAGELCETMYDPGVWRAFSARYAAIDEVARKFSEEFRKVKTAQGFLEIGDLEHLAMSCIRHHPDTVEAFCKEWDAWLVDEYQDTSPFQVELIRHLSGDRPNFIVGDPQQSIYLFRGARSEVFGLREREILDAGGERRLLSVNRRSRPELLLFLNDFFSRLKPAFQNMEPFLEEGQGLDASVNVATIYIAPAPPKSREEAPSAGVTSTSASEPGSVGAEPTPSGAALGPDPAGDEMRALVRHVRALLAGGASPEDICILARTNRVLTEAAVWLTRHRLPTHVHASAGFYDRREIRDALAVLKFLVNPDDGANLVELLRAPWFRVPDRALVPLARASRRITERDESLWDRLSRERSMADEFRAVGRLQELLQIAQRDGLSEAFRRALIEGGFIDLAHTHDVSGRRESNIWKLLSRLQQEECRAGFNPLAFIARSVSDLKVQEGNAEGDAVAAVEPNRINLMTVHASKGLEFKHVLLPRMEQRARVTTNEEFTYDEGRSRWALRVPFGEDHQMTGSLPEKAWLEGFQRHELEEHARVLYVALTRASHSVYLSWTAPAARNSWAEMVPVDLSPGEHQEPSYRYRVEISDGGAPAAAAEFETREPKPGALRTLWREPARAVHALGLREDARAPKELSVTELLERKPGVHRATATDQQLAGSLMSRARGTAVHKLMELIKYRGAGQLEQLISKWFPQQEDDVLDALNFVRAATHPPLLEIIMNGEVEKGFVFIEGPLMIPGQIDLWGCTNDGVPWIIDYKTGSPDDRDDAFAQMGIYALALMKSGWIQADEKIHLAAVYPFAQKIFTQDAPTREQVRFQLGLKDR